LVFTLALALVTSAGCSAPGAGSAPFLEERPAAPAVGDGVGLASESVLYSDDFSNPPTGWGTWNRGGGSVEYHNGGLRILVSQAQFDFWSVAGQKFADAVIEVDALRIGGPNDNDFGILCRYRDQNNFYMLVASSDGYYGIAKMKDGQHSTISGDQLQYSSALLEGDQPAPIRLRAACAGTRLTLAINGETLAQAEDGDFESGDVGVLAGSYDTPGVDILFDNFVVKRP
jgi:hypothetical protein